MPTFFQRAFNCRNYASKILEYTGVACFVLAAQNLTQENEDPNTCFYYVLMGSISAMASNLFHVPVNETAVELELPYGINPAIFRLLRRQVVTEFFQGIYDEEAMNNTFFTNDTTPEQMQEQGQALRAEVRRYFELLPDSESILTPAIEEFYAALRSEPAQIFFTDLATILANVAIRSLRNNIIQASVIFFFNGNRTRSGLQEFLVAANPDHPRETITTDRIMALLRSLTNIIGGVNNRLAEHAPRPGAAAN